MTTKLTLVLLMCIYVGTFVNCAKPDPKCPGNKEDVNCFADPCSGKVCDGYTCRADYCKGCNFEWFKTLRNGREITKKKCTDLKKDKSG